MFEFLHLMSLLLASIRITSHLSDEPPRRGNKRGLVAPRARKSLQSRVAGRLRCEQASWLEFGDETREASQRH